MDSQGSSQSSGSLVERNVIDFLAHRKSSTKFVHGNDVEESSFSFANQPRMQPPPGRRSYLCMPCGQRFSSHAAFESHNGVCGKRDQDTHTVVVVVNKQISCQFCDKTYDDINSLEAHLNLHHSTHFPFESNVSESSKGSKTIQSKQTSDAAVSNTNPNPDPDRIVTVVDTAMEEIERGEKLYKCSICGVGDDKTANLYKHMKSVHSEFTIVQKRAIHRQMKAHQHSQMKALQHIQMKAQSNFSRRVITNTIKAFESEKDGLGPENTENNGTTNSGNIAERSDTASFFTTLLHECSFCQRKFAERGEYDKHLKIHEGKSLWDYSLSGTTDKSRIDAGCNIDQEQNSSGYSLVPVNEKEIVNQCTLEKGLSVINKESVTQSTDDCRVEVECIYDEKNDPAATSKDQTGRVSFEVMLTKDVKGNTVVNIPSNRNDRNDIREHYKNCGTRESVESVGSCVKNNVHSVDGGKRDVSFNSNEDNELDDNVPYNSPQKEGGKQKVSVLSFPKPIGSWVPTKKFIKDDYSPEKWNSGREGMGTYSEQVRSINTPSEHLKTVRVIDIIGNGNHRYKCSACNMTSHGTSNLYQHMRSTHKDLTIVKKRNAAELPEEASIYHSDEFSPTSGVGKVNRNSQSTPVQSQLKKKHRAIEKRGYVEDCGTGRLGKRSCDRLNEKTVYVLDIPNVGSHRYQCSACSRTAASTGGLYDHMRRVHKGFRILLRSGQEMIEDEGEEDGTGGLRIAVDSDIGKGMEECKMNSSHECDDDATIRVIDVPIEGGGSCYKCSQCGSMANNISNLYKHMRRMHEGMQIAQRIKKRRRTAVELGRFANDRDEGSLTDNCESDNGGVSFENNASSEDEVEEFKCSECNKSFSTERGLQTHTRMAHKGMKFTRKSQTGSGVAVKKMKPSSKSVLDMSETDDCVDSDDAVWVIDVSSTEGQRFKCSECTAAFCYFSQILNHVTKRHRKTDAERSQCRTRTALLERHGENKECRIDVAIHKADREFKCSECDIVLESINVVHKHTKRMHSDMTIVYRIPHPAPVSNDIPTTEGGRRFKCSRCDVVCDNASHLNEHMKRMHQDLGTSLRKYVRKALQDDTCNYTENLDTFDINDGAEGDNEHMDCDWSEKDDHSKEVLLGNDEMEKLQHGGVAISKMQNVDNELSVNSVKGNKENSDNSFDAEVYENSDAFMNEVSSNEDFQNYKDVIDSSGTAETERDFNSPLGKDRGTERIKQGGVRKLSTSFLVHQGRKRERGLDMKMGNREMGASGTSPVISERPLDEQDDVIFNGSSRDQAKVVRPIVISVPGRKCQYKCSECKLICNVASNLYKHMKAVHAGMIVVQRKPSRKSVLDRSEIDSGYCLDHDTTDQSDTVRIIEIPPTREGLKFKCSRCDVICRDSSNLYKHMRRVHKGMQIICRKRRRRARSSQSLKYIVEDAAIVSVAGQDEFRVKEETTIKPAGKNFWEYCMPMATGDVPNETRENENVHRVLHNKITMLELTGDEAGTALPNDEGRNEAAVVNSEASASLDNESQEDDFSTTPTDVAVTASAGNAKKTYAKVKDVNVSTKNNSIKNTDEQSKSTTLNKKSTSTSTEKETMGRKVGVGACASQKPLNNKSDNAAADNSKSLSEFGMVHVIDVPLGKGRWQYKCSKCELVCNQSGNMYKHIKRMHKDSVLVPRARRNKAWYL